MTTPRPETLTKAMSDTIDALTRAIEFAITLPSGRECDHPYGHNPSRVTDRLAAALAADDLSIVKTADWERAQRVEAAARAYRTHTTAENGRALDALLWEELEVTP